MKKILIILFLAAFVGKNMAGNLNITAENMLSGAKGKMRIEVVPSDKNEVGLQFDMYVNSSYVDLLDTEGAYTAELSFVEGTATDHVVTLQKGTNGEYRFLVYSPTLTVIPTGMSIEIPLRSDKKAPQDTDASYFVSEIVFSDAQGFTSSQSAIYYHQTILGPLNIAIDGYYNVKYGDWTSVGDLDIKYTFTNISKESEFYPTGAPGFECDVTATSNVATYEIIPTLGTLNVDTITYTAGTVIVTKAPLAIKANDYSRYLGEDNPEFKLVYEGFKNNETEAVLTKEPAVSCDATKDSPIGEYDIIVSDAEATNYDISYTKGKLTVMEVPVTVTAKSYSRVYGDANPTFEYTSEGAALNGIPEITCSATTTSPVGTYEIVAHPDFSVAAHTAHA